MSVERHILAINTKRKHEEVGKVSDMLLDGLNNQDILQKIEDSNKPGHSSAKVQEAILSVASKLGFSSEKKELFANYPTNGLRPDYYRMVENSGILLEVERGKTTDNNMDMLDFWKCHICNEANYLFLLVPKNLIQNKNGKSKKIYNQVCNRMKSLFDRQNETNVHELHIFGY